MNNNIVDRDFRFLLAMRCSLLVVVLLALVALAFAAPARVVLEEGKGGELV